MVSQPGFHNAIDTTRTIYRARTIGSVSTRPFSRTRHLLIPSSRSQVLDHRIVIGMGTNPEPCHRVGVSYSQSAPVQADPNRINRTFRVQPLKLERFVIGILLPQLVSVYRLSLNVTRKRIKGLPEAGRSEGCHLPEFEWSRSPAVKFC